MNDELFAPAPFHKARDEINTNGGAGQGGNDDKENGVFEANPKDFPRDGGDVESEDGIDNFGAGDETKGVDNGVVTFDKFVTLGNLMEEISDRGFKVFESILGV